MDKLIAFRQKTGVIVAALLLAASLGSVAEAVPLRDPTTGNPTGNKHDFSKDNVAAPIHSSSEDRVCIFCHTPHGAAPQSTLWNRPSPQDPKAFALYSSVGDTLVIDDPGVKGTSLYDNTDTSAYPNGATRLCMSCHDGAVAIGTVLTGEIADGDTILTATVGGTQVIDLATSHPVSFVYDDGGGVVLGAINAAKGPGAYALPTLADVPLDGQGRMQCTTCHDPHEDSRVTEAGQPPFWRHVVAGNPGLSYDEVCNTCHVGEVVPGIGSNH